MPAIARKGVALLLALVLLMPLVGVAEAESSQTGPRHAPFWDIYGTRYQEAVDALYALRVVAGTTETAFEPNSQVTRAQMAALVARALGSQAERPESAPFPDVPSDFWAAPQITLAAQMGIVRGGSDGRFHPNDPVTYPQVVAMLLRALRLESSVLGDYPIGHVLLARKLGLIDGLDGWALDRAVPRGDVAIMLHRAIFYVALGGTGPTLSQSVFMRAGSVAILPDGEALPPGTTALSAKVQDWAGKELPRSVKWSILSGNATVDATGLLNATGPGPIAVTAQSGELSATRTFSIIQGLVIKADRSVVPAGGQVKLTAVGDTSSGKQVPVNPSWTIVSGKGTVSSSGVLTVQGPDAVVVQAAVGRLKADTTVSVAGSIVITPAQVVTGPNQEVQFTAVVKDAAGREIHVPLLWKVTGGGSIDQNGKFRAGNLLAQVTVQAGESSAIADVKIISRIAVSPGGGAFKKGDAPVFSAIAYTDSNEAVSVPVQWRVEPASLGFIGSDHRFFAANSGSGQVVASYGGLSASVPISVAGPAVGIQLTATPSTLPANGSSTSVITARLVDGTGATATGVDSIFITISSANLGKLDKTLAKVENGYASVILTAGTTAGSYSILATSPGSAIMGATLTFTTTVPAVDHVALEAYPNPLAADGVGNTTVTATLIDTTGAPMPNNTGSVIMVNLTASNSAAGRLNATQIQIGPGQKSGSIYFTASTSPGTTVVSGNSIYPVRSTAVVSQVVGGPYKVKIRPVSGTAPADGTSELLVAVEVQDANGNVRTGDNNIVISMNAISGSHSIVTGSQQTTWGVATFRLKTTVAGTYTVSVWGLNSALQGDSTSVMFTAGNPYKLSLSIEPSYSLAADGRTTATLKARILDANNNLVTGAANQVRFIRETASQNVTVLPTVTSVNAVNGEATLQITSSTGVGTDYFHTEADGLLQSNQTAVYTRITGFPVRVAVQTLSEPTIAAGSFATIRVWVLDQLGQLVTSDAGRMVTLYATNGAVVSGPTPTVNGVAAFTVSAARVGGVGLTATGEGVRADTVGRVLNVAPGLPDHVVLTANPEALTADGYSRTNISATLVDKYGNQASGSYTVTLTPSTTNYLTLSGTTLVTGGQVSVMSKSTPGTTAITGTAGGYPVTPLTITTYVAGTPTKVVLDAIPMVEAGNGLPSQVIVKARILDQNGNLVTSLNTGSELTALALRITGSTGTNTTNISMTSSAGLGSYGINPNGVTVGASAIANGIATLTITNTKAETITLTPIVYYRGQALESVAATMRTTAGPASRLTLSASAPVVSASTPTNVVVTATVSDVYGNPVTDSIDTMTFTPSTSLYLEMPSQNVVQTTGGSSTINVLTKVYASGGSTTITAISSRLGLVGTISIVTDLPPDKPNVIARDSFGSDTTISSGENGARIVLTFSARNASQQVLVYVNGVAAPLYTDLSGSTLIDTVAPGSTSVVGYIKRGDLGVAGLKEMRAVLQTPLGVGPLSDASILTLQ